MRLLLLIGVLIVGWTSFAYAQALPPVDSAYTYRIIEDREFTGGFYFTESDVQAFLEEKGEECEGDLCLKNYRDPETGTTAARTIATASQELGINPKVILVTLQKENSLVTAEEPAGWNYRTAMGYGCPDDADCEADYFGFTNQVRLGASLLRVSYDRACGDRTTYLRWWVNPQLRQGNTVEINNRPTYLGNCATAALYNYTPHRVDSAWRSVDGQHYYGNYNFVYYYQAWFLY